MAADDLDKVDRLRELLPATGAGIYLDTATAGPLPAETAAAMREGDEWELRVGRSWDGRDEDVAQRGEEARAVVAALIGADPAQVSLTNGRDDAFALAQPLAQRGARVIDATYRAGAVRVDVNDMGADAVAFACDRWLLGPEQTGALWLADPTGARTHRRLPRTTLIGVARSIGWLEMYVGLDWIYQRTAVLVGRLFDTLKATERVQLLTREEELAATVTFSLPRWPSIEAASELSRSVHALVRPLIEPNAIRASVAWFNTEEELDRFAAAVAALAAHTPDTLPRRPSLIVLGGQ